jgi:hypothetical protein
MASIPRRVNNPFRATRVTSAGPGERRGGSPPYATTTGYRGTPMWPGITEWSHDCLCSWAHKDGVMQVKATSGACPVREHRSAS